MRNYRPVSLLSVVSKVMEKVINTTLMNHLEKKRLLSQHQFGFRTGLSAADLLAHLSHQWLSCMNTGGAVRTVAVDIAGAFDKVSHIGVLHKLRSYGIAGTLHQWMTSYLTEPQSPSRRRRCHLFPLSCDRRRATGQYTWANVVPGLRQRRSRRSTTWRSPSYLC